LENILSFSRKNTAKLNKEEKQELLLLSKSAELKNDMHEIRKINDHGFSMDSYLEYLTLTNLFANHERKPFKRIEGNFFKI